ncbi:hypothetical protein CEXT_504371 [Caerostris extrusa]|uniref:Uncharacterized protein n=1 Tax=Caerostris extrusa TaxID=172846 RepID=A0AAV4TM88_CAEEX|nr:hypothetical protein CEXT_504371 [Caerostris extrusa]
MLDGTRVSDCSRAAQHCLSRSLMTHRCSVIVILPLSGHLSGFARVPTADDISEKQTIFKACSGILVVCRSDVRDTPAGVDSRPLAIFLPPPDSTACDRPASGETARVVVAMLK